MTGLLSFDAFRVRRSAARLCVCALLSSVLHAAALAQPAQPSLQAPPLPQASPAPEGGQREVAPPASPFQPAGRDEEGGEPGYLGLVVDTEKYNRGVIVLQVMEGGPAAKAGIQHADIIVRANDKTLQNAEQLGTLLRSLSPGGKVAFQLRRGDRLVKATAELGRQPSSSEAPAATAQLGITMSARDAVRASRLGLPPHGAVVERVTPGSAADEARIQPGSVIVQFAGQAIQTPEDLRSAVAKRRPGEVVNVRLYEGLRIRSLFVQLGAAPLADPNPTRSPQSVLRPSDEALTKPTEQALREELRQIRRDIEELQQRADALERQLQP